MINHVELGGDEALAIVQTEEGHFADLKSTQISPAKLSRTISAFANASGGDLFIGIDEDTRTSAREWNGFGTQEDANACIAVFENIYPLSDGMRIQFFRGSFKTS